MRRLLIVMAGLMSLLAWPDSAFACTCRDPRLASEAAYRNWLSEFDGVVFWGTVTSIESASLVLPPPLQPLGRWRVTFKVERYWKGVTSSEVVVFTPDDEGMCGKRFAQGRQYLVAATALERRTTEAEQLTTTICTPGGLHMSGVHKSFYAALGEGLPPPKP